MLVFRNTVRGASSNALSNLVSPSSNQIAFSRGSVAFVAINNEDSSWTAEFNTGLPEGEYCDVIAGAPQTAGTCRGQSYASLEFLYIEWYINHKYRFNVSSSGTFSTTISARNAVAIHIGALGTGDNTGTSNGGSATVIFQETATTVFGEVNVHRSVLFLEVLLSLYLVI